MISLFLQNKKIFSKKTIISFLFISILLSPFINVNAAINKQINYQGKLTNASNVAVTNGTYNMEFALYTVSSGGTAIWTETRTGGNKVQVTNGLFSVLLGEVTSLSGIDFNQTLYLGVNIGGTGTPGWDGEMSPRKKLGTVPSAVVSETALNIIGGNNTTLLGAIPYQSNTDTTSLLSPNVTTTKKFFRMTGTGTNGAVPAWDTLIDGDLPSTLTGKTYNGLTITNNGSNTLNIAASKTLIVSNSITLAGTDSSTLNIGAGGTLGSNAFTSTAYAPLASPTFTGTVTIPTPFTLGAVSVTSTGTQLNYLNAATGTTGTTSTNLVYSTSPTLVTPILGVATATSVNGLVFTAAGTGFTIAGGTTSKTLTVSNTLTLAGTDSSTLNIGAGGTLGSNAFTSTAYAPIASPTFTGTVTTPAITITTGATDGYFLRSDASGNGTWAAVAASQVYKGTWAASTNTPTLADGTGTAGWYYRAIDAGTVNFGAGNITFAAGDDVSYNGTIWQKIPGQGFTLQTATSSVLGGIKVGGSLQINASVLDVNNADMGDITVSGSGANTGKIWTIDNSSVTYAKIQNVSAQYKVLGRTSTGAGVIEELSMTGTGNVVMSNSPTLVTPVLGAATATTINGLTLTAAGTGFTVAGGTVSVSYTHLTLPTIYSV